MSSLPRSPVVYLDQNHWVTLARAGTSREKITPDEERDAADWLIGLCEEGAIRLPLSSAHAYEAQRARNPDRRRTLIETMLRFYEGWHMRHPVDVRRWELDVLLGLRSQLPGSETVFSQEPGTPFRSTEFVPFRSAVPGIQPQIRRQVEYLAWRDTWAAVLRETEPDDDDRLSAELAATRWSSVHQSVSDYVAQNPSGRDLRVVAATIVLSDLQLEIATAAVSGGLSTDQMSERTEPDGLTAGFLALPFVGRTMELIHQRLRNPQTSWVGNDLTDVMFLCCSAAYADVVVCEKVTANDLTRAQRQVPPGAAVFPNLRSFRTAWQTSHEGGVR